MIHSGTFCSILAHGLSLASLISQLCFPLSLEDPRLPPHSPQAGSDHGLQEH